MQVFVAPHAGELRDILDSDMPAGAVFVGDAAERHEAAIEGAGFAVVHATPEVSLADGLIRYLQLKPDALPVEDIAKWEPQYLRAPGAERLWTT